MNPLEEVARDHVILRTKLELMRFALRGGAEAWFVLREVCYELRSRLREHVWREGELLRACQTSFQSEGLEHVLIDHGQELLCLHAVNRLFVERPNFQMAELEPLLRTLIQRLQNHIAQQEARLFPVLGRLLGFSVSHVSHTAQNGAALSEDLTVNRLLWMYPGSRTVLARHFVDAVDEGQDHLDEVAWRHGLNYDELLVELATAIKRESSDSYEGGTVHAPTRYG